MKADGTCSVDVALRVIQGTWKPALVWHLLPGTRRYAELRRLVPGISERMLARQLRQLERDGIVERRVYPEVPPRVQYTLTKRGHSLASILQRLAEWAETKFEQADARQHSDLTRATVFRTSGQRSVRR